jgi:putative glycosyl transferase, group 1
MIKKVLFVCSIYKPNVGGVETAVEELCSQYNSLGIETCVLTKKFPFDLPEYEKDNQTDIIRVKRPLTDTDYLELMKQLTSDIRLKADVIHVMGIRRPLPFFALFLARYYNIPIVMNFVGSDVLTSVNPEDLKIWEERKEDTINSVQQADGFISFSEGITRAARNLLPQLNSVTTVYSGIDLAKINRVSPKTGLGKYIVAARRLIYNKGIDILIKAFETVHKEFPDISLYIIGDGPEKENLINLSKNMGLTSCIHFTGTLSLEELFAYMKGAILHVCPSRAEGGGIVNVEASACGCIPIGSNVDGIPEYIQDKISGLLFKSENYDDLAEKILEVIKNTERKNLMQQNGYLFAKTFDIEVKAQEYLSVYKNISSGKLKAWSLLSKQMMEVIGYER